MPSPDIDPRLQDRPYSGIAFKASHNSYLADKPPLAAQLNWEHSSPSRGACRGVELDLVQSEDPADPWHWSVAHGGKYSGRIEDQLKYYLGQLSAWSNAQNHNHGPVLVHLELKKIAGDDAQFPDAFDTYVTDALPGAQLYSAGNFLGDSASLLAAARLRGWPSLAALQGHFLFCITGDQTKRTAAYVTTNAKTRLCFCDRDIGGLLESGAPLKASDEPNRLIYNFGAVHWVSLPQPTSLEDGLCLLLRAYEVEDWDTWAQCLRRGVNMLATDQILYASFATVGPTPYAAAPR